MEAGGDVCEEEEDDEGRGGDDDEITIVVSGGSSGKDQPTESLVLTTAGLPSQTGSAHPRPATALVTISPGPDTVQSAGQSTGPLTFLISLSSS